jgi:hypothetical protein
MDPEVTAQRPEKEEVKESEVALSLVGFPRMRRKTR